jgi:hypothetical protein
VTYSKHFERNGTHRLVPSKYAAESIAVETLPIRPKTVTDLRELGFATDARRKAEQGWDLDIGYGELLVGVKEAHIVNAAFCYTKPDGNRFSTSRRGAWYAGVELKTSQAEVAFHIQSFVKESRLPVPVTFDYQEFLANFSGDFSHLEPAEVASCLQPGPVPQCYAAGQALAKMLLDDGSNGIIYPSVRNLGGTCVACFRPALVYNPRRGRKYQLWVGAVVHRWTHV